MWAGCMSLISISQAAEELRVPPRAISDLFWQGQLDRNCCPVVAGRRVIPRDYLPAIRAVLVAKGKIPELEAASAS